MNITKLFFIPNWNGHLFLQEYKDNSVNKLYKDIKFKNKEIIPIKKNSIEKTNNIIEIKLKKELNKNNFILSITGDHSNSYPIIKAFSENKREKNFKLIIFDAHPDVEIGTDLVSHEDYLRQLIENKIINPKNIYLFGIRTFSRTEFKYLLDKKINFFTISDILKDKNYIKKILLNIKSKVYLSIDIDVLDPDVAPGTYYREWCGLYLNELKEFIRIIKPNIECVDITEFYSEKDEEKVTEENVIKLIKYFLTK